MQRPNKPEKGMRVTYGRINFVRSGWKGTITEVKSDGYFTVLWDNTPEATSYRGLAWASTPFRNTLRNRDKHYLFFAEEDTSNKVKFPYIFDCGVSRVETSFTIKNPTIGDVIRSHLPETNETENDMKKTMIKQTLVQGVVIQEAHEETLIELIRKLEGDIAGMKDIKAKSDRIAAIIQEKKDAVDEVVKELDSRN